MANARRWDTDARGAGTGSAGAFTPAVQRLLEAMSQEGWVAEEPEVHLLPHLRAATDNAPAVWSLVGASEVEGRYVVDLEWRRRGGGLRDLVADAYALLGRVAEANMHVAERKSATTVEFDITTGMLDGDGPFSGHGHVIVLRIAGPRVEALLGG